MEKIGFFGGCFNPPNNLHIEIASNLIINKKIDKVVFVPVNDYYKKESLIDARHRYNMLKLAVKNYKNLEVDDIELRENRKLYAIDAFEVIQNSKFITDNNKNNIFFIMGSDNYEQMPNWKDYDRIKNKYNFIVVDRNKDDITSTKIRELLNKDINLIKQYLPREVYNYILENRLYKS